MKKMLGLFGILALTLASILVLASCQTGKDGGSEQMGSTNQASSSSNSATSAADRLLTAKEAKQRMDSGDPVVIVDVRTPEEYEAGHISGAILLPVDDIGNTKPSVLPDTGAELLVYCRSGNRSATAAAKLTALGYTNVWDFGGINSWPYATQKEKPTTTMADFKKPAQGSETSNTKAQTTTSSGKTPGKTSGNTSGSTSAATITKSTTVSYHGILSKFSAKTVDGKTVNQSIFSGKKLTMVNVWATFCGPCISEMPDLAKLNKANASKGFAVVGVISDAGYGSATSDAKDIIAQTGATYTHLLPGSDLNQKLLADVQVVPTTIFVDEHGVQVGTTYLGSKSQNSWQEIIDALLKKV